MSPEGVAALAIYGLVCLGIGWFLGRIHGLADGSKDLIQTYQHLLEYGRPTKPQAAVREAPPDPEQRIEAEISETARHRLSEHLAKESGASPDRAREEADWLLNQFETWGVPPS